MYLLNYLFMIVLLSIFLNIFELSYFIALKDWNDEIVDFFVGRVIECKSLKIVREKNSDGF